MSPLRQRMIDAMTLRGLAQRTQVAYVNAVLGLAKHYGRSPEHLSAQQVQQYLLHLQRQRHLSRSTVNQCSCACRFLYGEVLGRDRSQFKIPLSKVPERLPEILSRDELTRLFAASKHAKARTFLMLAYSTGLRVSELCRLTIGDIDSEPDRMCLRVTQGKGARDRYVPLTVDALALLRSWWQLNRPQHWVFRASTSNDGPLAVMTAQRWYRAACTAAGITKQGGIHTLRHCYATHLLESGVDLASVSQWLGHRHVSTTMRYLHLARADSSEAARYSPMALLSQLPEAAQAVPNRTP